MRPVNKYVNRDITNDMIELDVPVIYAIEYKDKWEAVQAHGYIPENAVWIDDRPMYIWMNRNYDELDE